MEPLQFLNGYLGDNFGSFGLAGKAPFGLVGSLAGAPSFGSDDDEEDKERPPYWMGGLTGYALGSLFG